MLTPYRTERMVKAFNAEIGLPLLSSTAITSAAWLANILKAAEAGAAIADTAHAPLAFGNSHPAVEMIVARSRRAATTPASTSTSCSRSPNTGRHTQARTLQARASRRSRTCRCTRTRCRAA